MDGSIASGLGCLYYGFIACFIGCLIMGGIHLYKWIRPKQVAIESTHIITPTIKLTIKDNKVDTIYVYKKS